MGLAKVKDLFGRRDAAQQIGVLLHERREAKLLCSRLRVSSDHCFTRPKSDSFNFNRSDVTCGTY